MATPKQEKRFDHKGYPCVILFMPMGYRCGYVGILPKHKYYNVDFDNIPINCHCGLTYSSSDLHWQNEENIWRIGFDCGHCCDGFDTEKVKELYAKDENVMSQFAVMQDYYKIQNESSPVRSLEYVEEECKKIVEQLIEVEE